MSTTATPSVREHIRLLEAECDQLSRVCTRLVHDGQSDVAEHVAGQAHDVEVKIRQLRASIEHDRGFGEDRP